MASKKSHADRIKLYRATRYTRQITDESIQQFLQSIDCPRSLTVWLLYKNKEHQQLVDLDFDPLAYNTAQGFRDAYASSAFLSKSDFLELEVSKKDAALRKFHEFENICKLTNDRFKNLSLAPNYHGVNATLLFAMSHKIESILGDFSPDEFVDEAGWGPGVSTLVKGKEVSAFNKFRDERGITRELYSLVSPWFSKAYPSWVEQSVGQPTELADFFTLEAGNRVVTVPKNSKTDRVIAIEPGFNIWFQKAIGNMIRKRLRREGIDLNTQERNQQLAKRASIDDSLATVDFSSASDSISLSVVREVMTSSRWISLLEACRSKYGTLDSGIIKWQKFSAMGNGFTFELESLIFYAAAFAVCKHLRLPTHDVSVFGDDVIIPKEAYPLYSSFTEFLGFKVNREKSFSSGYFRESCGAHFYDGVDCKPIYLKGKLQNVESLYKLVNSIRHYAHRGNSYDGCDSRMYNCWRHLFCRIPEALRFRIPAGFGDGGIAVNFDEAVPSTARKNLLFHPRPAGRGFEGYRFSQVAFIGVTRISEHPSLLTARVWGRSKEMAHNNEYTLRGTVRIRIIPDVLTSQWYNFGPWRAQG